MSRCPDTQALRTAPSLDPVVPMRPDGQARVAICLPTYNRCDLLAKSLADLVAAVSPHRIPIYVSDNHSDDATGATVQALQADYDLLYYSRCDALMSVDDHFQRVLNLPDCEYRWLFGDHYRIVGDEALRKLLASLDEGFDFVVVNAESRVQGLATQTFTRQDSVLETLSWHMTMMTSLVYSAAALKEMDFDRFRQTQLIQTLSIFEYLDRRPFKLRWLSDVVVGGFHVTPKNNWHNRSLQIFVRGWFVGIMSLPPGYAYDAKLRALRSHADNVSLFSFRSMLYLRTIGAISYPLVKNYARELPYVFDRKKRVCLWCCALLPVGIVRTLKRIAALARSRS